MRRSVLILLTLVALLAVTFAPALAVTDGVKDGDGHPSVLLLVMDVGGAPAFRCSGTLLSPTVFLTAGHCTNNFPDSPYTGMRVFTQSDVQDEIGKTNSYPTCGKGAGEVCFEAASWASHPLYETAPFFMHDVGVVILPEPGISLPAGKKYGVLPSLNEFDKLKTKRGLQDVTFTSVGYGLQESYPTPAMFLAHNEKIRYVATPRLITLNAPGFTGDFSLLLSNNANTGGTCFGDSGGPNFVGSGATETNVVAGVTSFGLNGNCAGTGGVFRMDREDVLDFVNSFLH